MRRLVLSLSLGVLLLGACSSDQREASARTGPTALYASTLQGEPTRIMLYDVATGADRLLDVDHFDGLDPLEDRWLGSPDGRWVALGDHTKIQIGRASAPLPMRRIAGRTTANDRLGDFLWEAGGERLFYVEYRRDRRNRATDVERRVFAVTPGGGRARVGVFRQDEAFGLVGIDASRRLSYWLKEGHGAPSAFTAIHLDTGATMPVMTGDELRRSFAWHMAPDARSVYYVEANRRLVRRDLPEGTTQALYILEPPAGNESNLHGGSISPDGRRLTFAQTAGGKHTTFVVSLPDGEPEVLLESDSGSPTLSIAAWSPDGRYVWVTTNDARSAPAIMDVGTRERTAIPRQERPDAPEYRRAARITFLAWLSNDVTASGTP